MQHVDGAYLRLSEFRRPGESDGEFGKRLGVSQQAVRNWRKGEGNVSRETLERASEEFGVSLDYLVYGEEDRGNLPTRLAIAHQMRKLVSWVQGEAVDWTPPEPEELQVRAARIGESPTDGGEGAALDR